MRWRKAGTDAAVLDLARRDRGCVLARRCRRSRSSRSCASRQGVWAAGSWRGGRRCAPTPFRCSPGSGAAQLAPCPCGALRSDRCSESVYEARAAHAPRSQAALLTATQVAHVPDPLPRGEVGRVHGARPAGPRSRHRSINGPGVRPTGFNSARSARSRASFPRNWRIVSRPGCLRVCGDAPVGRRGAQCGRLARAKTRAS